MQTVTVRASKTYDVLIGRGVKSLLGEKIKTLFGTPKAFIVTDSNVAPLHLSAVETVLDNAGIAHGHYIFPHGESSKNPQVLFDLLETLASEHLSRKDVLIALGGGVTGDLTGLAAALFMRGMHLVQMPTTLLSMVDSSVGGKTAVNLKAGKNLAGVFNQPELVLCDVDFLGTLPPADFADGMAEVIKYGVIADEDLFEAVKNGNLSDKLEAVITRCVSIKRDVVAEDEFDTGKRALLNFGHTLAHAIEAQSNFTISHGKAVAVGMVRIATLAEDNGFCTRPCRGRIVQALQHNGLPTDVSFTNADLFASVTSDKKCAGGKITLVLPNAIGDCFTKTMPVSTLKELLQA